MARFRMGALHVAIEVGKIVSLLDRSDLSGSEDVVDLAASWGIGDLRGANQFAVVEPGNTILALGGGVGFENWSAGRLARMPSWLSAHLPVGMHNACGYGDDGELVFIVDTKRVDELRQGKS